MNYYWVNQANFEAESGAGIILSHVDTTNHARLRIFEVKKGDLIFSFNNLGLQAVIEATSDPMSKDGVEYTVSGNYQLVEPQVLLTDIVPIIIDELPTYHSPINRNGGRCQGYLYSINSVVAERLSLLADLSNNKVETVETTGEGTERRSYIVNRVVRDTKNTLEVKRIYDNTCQVCNDSLETPKGKYSEGAHIIPLGYPHNGDDTLSNMLCLCPNHHVMFDRFGFTIDTDGFTKGLENPTQIISKHNISKTSLVWHMEMYYNVQPDK
ncbi:HNH endonuclease [Vibrio parahaemolyticus]|nr:HNH endonuclease [Vibrio parahaemolyticus]EGR1176520.1 HNH endonuclease [Vibrio parahaemolyticus]EJG0227226.1 HNH endonuclease [Vibrio parahaemolyticus]EJG0350972.1 HNH endonuclease [Vibrio parahaemolyticus]EJG0554571.1 HNH endonuclease [Vibrio parahaemolyticus]